MLQLDEDRKHGLRCCLVFSVQLGIQTLPFLLSGELFPADIRAFCKGLTRSFACLLLIGSLKMFPLIENSIGLHGTFWTYSVISFFAFMFALLFVPETRGKTLDEMEPKSGILTSTDKSSNFKGVPYRV